MDVMVVGLFEYRMLKSSKLAISAQLLIRLTKGVRNRLKVLKTESSFISVDPFMTSGDANSLDR